MYRGPANSFQLFQFFNIDVEVEVCLDEVLPFDQNESSFPCARHVDGYLDKPTLPGGPSRVSSQPEGRMPNQYLSELVCRECGRTGHITWEGTGTAKRVVEVSESVKHDLGPPPVFTCADCGTSQQPV